ncbi:hypothetical protein ACJX0J_011026, partial [Zea mays]
TLLLITHTEEEKGKNRMAGGHPHILYMSKHVSILCILLHCRAGYSRWGSENAA